MDQRIGEAVQRLPERQREALELRERGGLSYERIAARMGTGPGQVAQLIERARINLYDELEGTPLAAIAAPSRECEQALQAIAAREDGELDALPGVDAAWLDRHLAECERCRPAVAQMAEATAAFRAQERGEEAPRGRRRRIAPVVAAALLLLAGVAAALVAGGDDGAPASGTASEVAREQPAGGRATAAAKASTAAGRRIARRKHRRARRARAGGSAQGADAADGRAAASAPLATPVAAAAAPPQDGGKPASDPDSPSGKAGLGPTRKTASPQPSAKPAPAPTSTQASQPATTTTSPPAQPSPPADEEPDAPGRSGEAPGKPANRPPK